MRIRSVLLTGTCLLLLVGSTLTTPAQNSVAEHLQKGRGVTRVGQLGLGSTALDLGALDAALKGKSASPLVTNLRISFFPDVSVVVSLDHAERSSVTEWSGKVQGMEQSSATFVQTAGGLMGSVNLGNGKVYQLRTLENGTQWALEIDQSRFPNDESDDIPALQPPDRSELALLPDAPIASDDGSIIDVLVVYTPAARIAAGGTTQMQQLVQLGIAETNTAYLNSGIIQRVRLAQSQEIDYQEASTGIRTDLSRLATLSDGHMDEIGALRNTYTADLVSLWVSTTEGTCGIGYGLSNPAGNPTALAINGFSVAELNCATGYYTFGHEMGHNMGAAHSKEDLGSDGSVPVGAYPYSNGFKQATGSDRFRTVMAYDCSPSCPRIQYFSNPLATYRSLPVGISSTSAQSADNAQTLNNTRNIVANYRTASTGSTGGSTDTTAPLLTITTPSQSVTTNSISIIGTATDSGRGNSGISSVTVNGVRASNDTASTSGTSSWSRTVALTQGANVISVIARDNSAALNPTIATITITLTSTTSTASSATASTYHVFPQFADGRLSDGTYYKTTAMLSNPSTTAASNCTLQLRGLALSGFQSTYSLAAGGWAIASTSGTGAFQSGYASLSCTAAVEAQLLYSFYLSNGTKVSEATVFSSPPAARVKTIADEREGAQLGLAIANDTDQAVTYTVSVTNATSTGTVTLPPRSSVAKFIKELVPGVPANNQAQVIVSANTGTASIIGLRFTGGTFTTIPQSVVGTASATASTYHVFPQFADGRFPDGTYYRTTRIYINPSSTDTVSCATQLRGLSTDDRTTFSGSLGPGGTIVAATTGTQSFQSGYATMQCSGSVDAEALYSLYAANGAKLSEATVFSSPAGRTVQILADSREGAQVGLAIANDSDQANTYTITVYDSTGNLVGSISQPLAARTSVAKFVSQFVALPPNHFGKVIVAGTGDASIIGLRFTGTSFTTIPQTIIAQGSGVTVPTGAVTVTRVYASDTSDVEKTSFTTGQTVRLNVDRNSTATGQVLVEARYKATGPSSYVLLDSLASASTAPAGPHGKYVDVVIPQAAPAGTYTFEATVTYSGAVSTKSTTFTLTASTVTTTPVTVTRAYLTDTTDVEKTTFAAGQTIRLKMDRSSTLTAQVNVEARYKATGPSSHSLVDGLVAASTAPPGAHTRYVEILIPASAPVGVYIYDATATYNGVASSKSSTFTVTSGAPVTIPITPAEKAARKTPNPK